MPPTTDPIAVITQLLLDANAKLDKVIAGQTAAVPAPAPAPEDEAEAFLKRWAAPPLDEFRARYNVSWGQMLPQMTTPDAAEATYRGRAGYSWQGACYLTDPAMAAKRRHAVEVVAHATDVTAKERNEVGYDTGYGLVDPDFAAYGFLTGLFSLWEEQASNFGVVGYPPKNYAGYTIQTFLEAQHMNTSAGPGIG